MTTFSDLVSKINVQLEGQNLFQVPYFLTLNFPHLLPPVGQTSPSILRSTARWHREQAGRLLNHLKTLSKQDQGLYLKKVKYHEKIAEQLWDSADMLETSEAEGAFYEWEGRPNAGLLSPT